MDDEQKECPFCAELIKKKAIVCRYCGRDIPEVNNVSVEKEEQKAASSVEKVPCDRCGAIILPSTAKKTGGFCMRCAPPRIKFKSKSKAVKGVKCPSCGKETAHRISIGNKVGSAALFNVFALGHISKTFKCENCGYKW